MKRNASIEKQCAVHLTFEFVLFYKENSTRQKGQKLSNDWKSKEN